MMLVGFAPVKGEGGGGTAREPDFSKMNREQLVRWMSAQGEGGTAGGATCEDVGNLCNVGCSQCDDATVGCVVSTFPTPSISCTSNANCPSGMVCCSNCGGRCAIPCGGCFNSTDCNDGDACTVNTCLNDFTCDFSEMIPCTDMNPCTNEFCDTVQGCQYPLIPCDDMDGCTLDGCDQFTGMCVHTQNCCTSDNDCDDNDSCPNDTCDETTGFCVFNTPPCIGCENSDDCDDGSNCTTDTCVANACQNLLNCAPVDPACFSPACISDVCQIVPINCDDGDECTADSCMESVGCQHTPIENCGGPCMDDTDCDDGNECTDNTCFKGFCEYPPISAGACDDGDDCTENDLCVNGQCVGTPIDCDDMNACTTDSCVGGLCEHEFICGCSGGDCCTPSVGVGCTDAACCECVCALDPFCCSTQWDGLCVGEAIDDCPDACPCDCGDPSRGDCCSAHSNPHCDDEACCDCVCAIDSFCCETVWDSLCAEEAACECATECGNQCDPSSVACCEDSDCDDGNVCTIDSCQTFVVGGLLHGCVNEPIDGGGAGDIFDCDGDLCTLGDMCSDGNCIPGAMSVVCDDMNPCTDDACNPMTGMCEYTNDDTNTCTDNNDCTTMDACVAGQCVGSVPPNCDDGIACTVDSCAPMGGCMNTPNHAACNDNNACTTDICSPTAGCQNPCTDTVNPVPTCPPAMLTVECDEPVPPFNPTFLDNCDPMLLINAISTPAPGDCPQEGTISRSTSATDDCGNSATCSQVVMIVDTTPPMVSNCPTEVTYECDQPMPPFNPMFADNCDTGLMPTGDCVVYPGKCPQESDTLCTLGAQDDCGNLALCQTTFHKVDTTPPVVTCEPVVYVPCRSIAGIPVGEVFIPPATAVDNCDTYLQVTDDRPTSGNYPVSCDEPGTFITFTAVDDCGNIGTCVTEVRVVGGLCCPAVTDTDLKLMVLDLDLRQDTDGPVRTKARFDIWNMNEVRFSGTERCITCWDETLISHYLAPHMLIQNLQTDKGKARIQNEPSPLVCGPSSESPLLGVAIREYQFLGSPHIEMRSAVTMVGSGDQSARIRYDRVGIPPEATGGEGGRLSIDALVSSIEAVPAPPMLNDNQDHATTGGVAANRASTTFKGSLIIWPVIEVKWDAHGTLIQDTFIHILNDFPANVEVQFYMVNGDAPLAAVFDSETNQLIERAHPGWNWSDYKIMLTGDESTYWSVASGLPKGVSPIAVLDAGNPNGRPDPDPTNPGGRVIRGFLLGWALNSDGNEIRWNHLKGHAVSVRYDQGTAFDYNPWSFRVVSGVNHGAEPDPFRGNLNLDGLEYDLAPRTLLFDFYAAGSQAHSHPAVRP